MSKLESPTTVTSMPGRALSVVLASLLASMLGACLPVDECQYTDAHCEGDVAMQCANIEGSNGSYKVWQSTRCGAGMCKLDPTYQRPFCALSADPEPRCDAQHPSFCDGNALIECQAGYAISSKECGSSDPHSAFCVSASTESRTKVAFCAAEAEPNPLCAQRSRDDSQDWFSAVCDGNDRLDCKLGYEVSRLSCGDRFCRSHGSCMLSSDPDPRCASPTGSVVHFCEDDTIVFCADGYRQDIISCPSGQSCHSFTRSCPGVSDGGTCSFEECAP